MAPPSWTSRGRSPHHCHQTVIGCGFTRRASGGSGVTPMPTASEPSPPSPDVTTQRKARRGGPGDRKVCLRDEERGINGQMRRLVSSLLNACASFPQGGRLPVDFAGMAQRNPLLHYTKKIVADATEHDDRGDGPHDEYGGHVFSPLNKGRTEERGVRSRNLKVGTRYRFIPQPSREQVANDLNTGFNASAAARRVGLLYGEAFAGHAILRVPCGPMPLPTSGVERYSTFTSHRNLGEPAKTGPQQVWIVFAGPSSPFSL